MEGKLISKDINLEHMAVSGVIYITVDNYLYTKKFTDHVKVQIVFDKGIGEIGAEEQVQPQVSQNDHVSGLFTTTEDFCEEELSDNNSDLKVTKEKFIKEEKSDSEMSMIIGNNRKQRRKQLKDKSNRAEPISLLSSCEKKQKQENTGTRTSRRFKSSLTTSFKTANTSSALNSKSKRNTQPYSRKLEEERDINCSYCSQHFRSQQEFFNHRKAERQEYPCSKCDKILPFKAHLMVHMRNHNELEKSEEENDKSENSESSIKNSANLSSDIALGNSKRKSFKCEICGHVVVSLSNLKSHTLLHTGEFAYKCCVCGEKMASLSRRSNHMSSHSQTGWIQCKICNMRFDSRGELSKHKLTHTYSCDLCGKTFPNRTGRNFHFKTAHKDDILKCPTCDQLYSDKKSLDAHMRFHYRKKSQCPVCGLVVLRLKRHMLTHPLKSDDADGTFVCDKCPKQFTNKTSLQSHLRTHSEERPYACTECSKRFSDCGGLGRHMLIHLPEKPYVCEVCGKACSQWRNLKIHMKIHKVSRAFGCSRCGLSFTHKNALQDHRSVCGLLEEGNTFRPTQQYFQSNTVYPDNTDV